jgi:sulfoxide reductase catalytic subunit YedY
MLIKRPSDTLPSEITPERVYLRRRELLRAAAAGTVLAASGGLAQPARAQSIPRDKLARIDAFQKSPFSTTEKPNSWKDITEYCNYYEFGTDKEDPAEYAYKLKVRPWTVRVDGEVKNPKTFDVEELMKLGLEERVYRLRCVEGWSMVIPWIGFEFNRIAKIVEPTGNAKFVEFVTALQPENMPGARLPVLDWPYVEGLRLDEAMHPLTIMAVGLYDRVLPNQNGAPIRMVVPWKYGFKSGKSIVRIRFVEKQPKIAWEKANAQEYGFYSNVNPNVDHPRWSQATERRLGEFGKRKTTLFNGYGDQVASMYAGMDLKKFF